MYQRLHSSITLEIRKRSARQIRSCWPVAVLPAPLELDLQPAGGAPPFLSAPPCVSPAAHVRLCSQPFLAPLRPCLSRFDQLRQLAARLGFLVSLEVTVAQWHPLPAGSTPGPHGARPRAAFSEPAVSHGRNIILQPQPSKFRWCFWNIWRIALKVWVWSIMAVCALLENGLAFGALGNWPGAPTADLTM